jgi:hypothetical protein
MACFTRTLALVLSVAASGCYDQGDGVDPPLGELYFPTGLALSVGATRLYAISSDFDLQYNGGAVHALDLERIRQLIPRECGSDADCDANRHCDLTPTPENRNKPSNWCVDNDGPHAGKPCGPLGEKSIAARSTIPGRCAYLSLEHPQDGGSKLLVSSVGIGAFATDIIYRQRPEGPGGRLFIPVRGDATLHYIDTIDETEEPMPFELSCGQNGNDGKCDDAHRKGDDPDEENTRGIRLRPEPFGIAATADARAMAVTHQTEGTVSVFASDVDAWGDGITGFGVGPKLEFELAGLPQRPIGIVDIPVPKYALDYADDAPYDPGFLVTYRDAAQIDLLRFFVDTSSNPPRPFVQLAGSASITANSLGFDSRGIALDPEPRQTCEADCGAAPDPKQCLAYCAGIQIPVYVANRSPSSLLVGKTRAKQNPVSSDDLPNITDSIPVTFGPSRVVVGKVVDQSGALSTRVFVVSFDTRRLSVYDPQTRLFETFITGRGPHGLVVDSGTDQSGNPFAHAYVAHFTDSYIGIIDLDQRHKYYGTTVVTLGEPHTPRASK